MTFIVIALIVIVAALNILIALTMMVMEKTRDIAVMMSFGVEPGQVRRIFLLQGFLISVIGTALGLVLGYAGVVGRRALPLHSSVGRGLLDRYAALCAAAAGRGDCGGGLDRDFAAGYALSVVGGGAGAAGGGAAVRVAALTGTFDFVAHFVAHWTHGEH